MSDTASTPDFSDYVAALKRRRGLLFAVGLPILVIAVALAIGLPDIYVSTGLITFRDATVSGQLPTDKERATREKSYMDEYVRSLSESVMSPPSLVKLVKAVPQVAAPGDEIGDTLKTIARKARIATVKVPVLDPDSSRERVIISAFTVEYDNRDPDTALKAATWLTNAFLGASRANLQVRANASAQ